MNLFLGEAELRRLDKELIIRRLLVVDDPRGGFTDPSLGKYFVKYLTDPRLVGIGNGRSECANDALDFFIRVFRDLSNKNFRMVRLIEILTRDLELFEKLFAFSHAGENDIDVFIRR